jgi:hypothetical protein
MTTRDARRWARAALVLGALGAASMLGTGCAATATTVYQREHLVDPIMSFEAQARLDARKMKSFEAREGSTGGTGGAGGGCACN